MKYTYKKLGSALVGIVAILTIVGAELSVPATAVENPIKNVADNPQNGSTYEFTTTINEQTFTGTSPQGAYPEGIKPAPSINVTLIRTDTNSDGTTHKTTKITNITGQIVDTSVSRENDINQERHKGTAIYAAEIDGQTYKATFTYNYIQSKPYNLIINGNKIPIVKKPDNKWGVANENKISLSLAPGTTNQLAADQTIQINDNGKLTNIIPSNWGQQPSFTGADGFTTSNTFVISGSTDDVTWQATLTATRPNEKTGQITDEDRVATIAEKKVPLSKQSDGSWKVEIPELSIEPEKRIKVTANHHHLYENGQWKSDEDTITTYWITASEGTDNVSYPQFGEKKHEGTQLYIGKDTSDIAETSVFIKYSYITGKQTKIIRSDENRTSLQTKDKPATETSVWGFNSTDVPIHLELTESNKIAESTALTFTDGTNSKSVPLKDLKINYGKKQIVNNNSINIVKISGTILGKLSTDGGDFQYEIPFIADRTYNDTIKALRVTETTTEGNIHTYDQTLDQVKTEGNNKYSYQLNKLPYSHITSTYTIAGVDAGSDVTLTVSPALHNENGSLVFTVLARSTKYNNTYQITLPFEEAPLISDNNVAHLSDITVNGRSIVDVNGNQFDQNRFSYTIKASAEEKVYILPHATKEVFISAGDVTQSAGASTYRWNVSQAGKKTTIYSVTVLRERDWKTADEEFTPLQPILQEGTEIASDDDTSLQSHGYVDSNGKYIVINQEKYTIPDGGIFSYQAKSGQVTAVTSTKIKGMTYLYTVNVASPGNLDNFVQHNFTITYITPSTRVAFLTGIKVNGKNIDGFLNEKYDYTVEVDRIDQWTIVPQYDEKKGMVVTTHKDGAHASIDVISADETITKTYKVTVVRKNNPNPISSSNVGILAQTGSSILPVVVTSFILLLIAGLSYLIAKHNKNN